MCTSAFGFCCWATPGPVRPVSAKQPAAVPSRAERRVKILGIELVSKLGLLRKFPDSALQLFAVFRIHRFGSAAGRFIGNAIALTEFNHKLVGSREVVGYGTFGPLHLANHLAWIRSNVLVHVQLVIGAADKGFA